ncbi:helix-turn-helix domain-containing protein [Blautia schinkii]|nr:helix-turn-helix domain-containing protein [Blautia schinkii]
MNDGDRLIEVGKRIKRLRRGRDISQFSFAESLGISDTTVSRIENGSTAMNILLLMKISDVLDVEVTEILNPPKDQ